MTRSPADDSRRLLASLCSGLVLLAPLSWTLERPSYLGVAFGLVASALTAVAFGALLSWALPDGLVTALLTAAWLLPLSLVALLVTGPRTDGVATALTLGLPAAAVSAVLAVRTTTGLSVGPDRKGLVRGATVVGASLALSLATLAPAAHGPIAVARAERHIVAALEGGGVLPLRIEVDGFSPAEETNVGLGSDGYQVRLVADGEDPYDAASIHVEAGPLLTTEERESEQARCDSEGITCTQDGDGVLVIEGDDESTRVVATFGRTRLEAVLYDGLGGLPDPDEVGQALDDAELVTWDDVLQLNPGEY